MSVRIQVRITRRPKPAPEPADAPTTDARIAKVWF